MVEYSSAGLGQNLSIRGFSFQAFKIILLMDFSFALGLDLVILTFDGMPLFFGVVLGEFRSLVHRKTKG